MVHISDLLLNEYIKDKRYASIAGLIRQAYTEDGNAGKILRQVLGAVGRHPEVKLGWKMFFEHTVPRLEQDAKDYVEQQRLLAMTPEQKRDVKKKARPAPRRRK